MDSTANGLGKLLPKAIAEKRRRKRASSIADTTSSNDDVAMQKHRERQRERGNSTVSRSTTESERARDEDYGDDDDQSNSNSNVNGGEDNNDLISFDSDPEPFSTSSRRPTAISPHPSQIGLLTTSSPLVQAAHLAEQQAPETQQHPGSLARSATVPQKESLESLTSEPSLKHTSTGLVFRSRKNAEKSSSEERLPASPTPEPVQSVSKPDPEIPESPTSSLKKTATEPSRRLSRGQTIEPLPLKAPNTPPSEPPPIIVNTPPTPTDHTHPPNRPTESPNRPSTASSRGSPRTKSDASPGSMISQRRSRAGSGAIGPSKLSNITPAPLTPTPDAGPGTPANSAANFFSSMFSAVQNTATTFGNTIANTNLAPSNSKNRPLLPQEQNMDRDNVEVESSSEALPEQSDSKEPAVKTLGMGDLSLSQLGIVETANTPTPTATKFAEAEARVRADSAPADIHAPGVDAEDSQIARPRSLYEAGDQTPPAGSLYEGKSGIHRSGSIRSVIGRRKRGSSAATGGTSGTGMTIAAAIVAANASVAHPTNQGGAPKLTGFAVATKKRNRDFHTLFKSVPDDDYLIEDYSCALQREILAHGRLYVSEGHLCFSSNILGWVTTLVMSFDEIVSVEKRSTALVFKNGLEISTLHAKHVFASFTSRDTTYDLIVKIWKLGHPQLQSSLNGVRLEETGGDRTEKIEEEGSVSAGGSQSVSGSDDESDEGDDVYDEDEENDEDQDSNQMADDTALEIPTEKTVTRKPSSNVRAAAEKQDESAAATSGTDFPGPATHAPTECGDVGSHYDKILGDEIISAPLGKIYDVLFGPGSAAWMADFLCGNQKCFDMVMEDKRGLTEEIKTRTFSYIKPLGASIGPKQTKCIVTEQLEGLDLNKSVNILCSTQNPDVPSGNIFVVKTRYCLTWAENNSTRVQSWLKGPIENGANNGQTQYCKDLFASLKASVATRARSSTLPNGGAAKGKKRGRKNKSTLTSNPASDVESLSKVMAQQDWGLLEPLRPFLSPVADTVRPILTGNVVYGLLVGLLVATWFGFGSNRQATVPFGPDLAYVGYPQRLAAYEEMWRREESDLWDWIEERAGLDRLGSDPLHPRKRAVEFRTVEERLREEKMDEREVREAIRVTEEHLQVLKSVVNKEKETGSKR
ncbi:hypothetical protein B0T19DRAFT_428344 [Cercophora scortea]|uniref:VASt domain-containing protein n=1 Tax=Cercophora scortea TaxID=314031 RepID=A0AAE0M9E6_9PEZI|nr:hypothetical protein B0T19DRAFT_428344 [Cercophora scortea]